MSYVTLSNHTILRAEPGYFGTWAAFHHRTYSTRFVSAEVFAALNAIGQRPMEWNLFKNVLSVVCGPSIDAAGLADALVAEEVVSLVSNPGSRYPFPRVDAIPTDSNLVPYLSTPTSVEVCITRRCNLSCAHCNVSAQGLDRPEKMPIEFWTTLVDQCVEANVLRLTITGGEPFLRHHFDQLLQKVASSRLGAVILSNGTAIDDQQMSLLAEARIGLSISLDAATPEIHDKFRGHHGAFSHTMQTLRRLSRYPILVVLNMTLTAASLDDAKALLELAKDLGVARVVFVPIYAVGRATSKQAARYFPDKAKLQAATSELLELANRTAGPEVVVGDPTEKQLFAVTNRYSGPTPMSKRHPGFCKAGIYGLAVDEDGLVYSCLRGLQARVFCVADLKRQTLSEAWASESWRPWRDPSLALVPCRVEQIEREQLKTVFMNGP